MKIFADSTNIDKIQESSFLIDGITTNPNLMKSVTTTKMDFAKKIAAAFPSLPISIQIHHSSIENMLAEAHEIHKIAQNIVIKVPITQNGLIVTSKLSELNIKVNMTLCFTLSQAILAAKVGATYVSPFVARLEDANICSYTLLKNIRNGYNLHNYSTQILAASIRNKKHFEMAVSAGADIATMSPELILSLHENMLTDIGLKEFNLSHEIEE